MQVRFKRILNLNTYFAYHHVIISNQIIIYHYDYDNIQLMHQLLFPGKKQLNYQNRTKALSKKRKNTAIKYFKDLSN